MELNVMLVIIPPTRLSRPEALDWSIHIADLGLCSCIFTGVV